MHVLISGTCEYVTLCGKKDFGNVFTLRILKWEVILDNRGGPNAVTRVLILGREEGQSQRSRCDHGGERQTGVTDGFDPGGGGHELQKRVTSRSYRRQENSLH